MKAPSPSYRNQRLGRPKQRKQQHLLEVSIRRDKELDLRLRRSVFYGWRLLVVTVLGVGTWVGTREAVQRYIWHNPRFFLNDVRVATDGTLTRDQIITNGGVVEGANIFTVDAAKIRTALNALPQVEHAEVQRTFPHRLDIEITERQPVAWITEQSGIDPTASDRAFLVDAHGYVMKSRKLLPEYSHLPIISGAEVENLAAGQRVHALELLAALELLHQNNDNTRWQINNVDVSKRYCLVANYKSHGVLVFGLDNIDRQLGRLNRLIEYTSSQQKEIQTANLLVERNTPVTFYDPDTEARAAAASTTPAGTPPPGRLDEKKAAKPDDKKTGDKTLPKSKPDPKEKPKPDAGKSKTFESVRKPFRSHG